MKKIFKNWKLFLTESQNDFVELKNKNFKNCWQVDSFLSNNYTKETDLECVGIGTDKIVLRDKTNPDYVIKIEKKDPIKENSTMETVVWKYLKDTPFSKILAPIIPKEGYYHMKYSNKSGNYEDLENALFEISEETGFKFQNLKYWFLSDANRDNIREIDGRTVLIDYDDVWPWVFKNKQNLKDLVK